VTFIQISIFYGHHVPDVNVW